MTNHQGKIFLPWRFVLLYCYIVCAMDQLSQRFRYGQEILPLCAGIDLSFCFF